MNNDNTEPNPPVLIEASVEGIDEESNDKERKLLAEARERLADAIERDSENRRAALDDLQFVYVEDAQWPPELRAERISEGRPCITVNKMPIFIDQVVGDQRQNRPSIKVVPVDSKSDTKIANILSGWIKHVFQVSQADVAIDHSFEHAVACGYGAMRVVTKYSDDSSFEQEAYIEKIDDALSVFWGKHSQYDCSDAQYCFIISDIDREEYKAKYNHDIVPFSQADTQLVSGGWITKNTVRVAEYFVKEPVQKTIYSLADGRTVDTLLEGDMPVNLRKVESYKIKWYLLSGDRILDEKYWVGNKYIPVIPVWGKEINAGGKRLMRGLIRFAKGPQMMYNYWTSCDTETVALSPKTPYLVTPEQISGHELQWNDAHRKNFPYLITNPDPKAPGWPKREPPPQVSTAMVSKIQMVDQEIRDTVGLQKASLGMPSNERSGVAIRERKQEGDVGTFAFIDNLSRSIEYLGRVLVDMSARLLDTERILRLGLGDGTYRFESVNVEAEEGVVLNDLSLGTYDVVVSTGPSFTTQRTEARRSMSEFIQYFPAAAPLIGDLYAKSMDWPGSEDMAKRLEVLLPPEIKEEIAAERQKEEGAAQPPPPPEPPPPDPGAELNIQKMAMELEELKIKIEQEKAKLAGLQLENQIKAQSLTENTINTRYPEQQQ